MKMKMAGVACWFAVAMSMVAAQQTNDKPKGVSSEDTSASRLDGFAGYSYWAPHGSVQNMPFKADDQGMLFSGAWYFNRWMGGQVEGERHQQTATEGMRAFSAGPIFRLPSNNGMSVFAHALAGAAEVTGPNVPSIGGSSFFFDPETWGVALTVGGGLDYRTPLFDHHLSLRVFQADYQYLHVDFGPELPTTGGRANLDSARLSTGIVYSWGSITPPPLQYSCSAEPSSVFPGDAVTITGTASNVLPKKTATYSWSGQGVNVSGTDSTVKIDTGSLQPGNYTVTGHATDGKKAGRSADCTAQFTVKQFEPPTISCSANPTTVKPGDSSTVTCNGVSPQNRPLTYSYSASAGSISGTGNTATLATTGAPAGSITVTGTVQDDKGQTASATTTVDVQAPPPPPQPKTQTLCSIQFTTDKRRPARVDNEAKACLDDVALNAQQKADASVVVVGNASPHPAPRRRRGRHAKPEPDLAAQRAVNTKAYLVTEKGIDASRIQVRTGTNGQDEVEDYLVPAGANFDQDVPGTNPVDENAVKPQARKPLATHHHHHHHAAAKTNQ